MTMLPNIKYAILTLISFSFFGVLVAQDSLPEIKGPYLGQKPPGMIPAVFAPGIVSTEKGELNIIISPDGNEIYFSRSRPSSPTAIMVMINKEGKWHAPRVASFSGQYSDMDPSMSKDGTKIFFGSTRPTGNVNAQGCDIWLVERLKPGNWSDPRNIGEPVNTPMNDNYPTLTKAGTIYYQSKGHGGKGGLDIFRSELINGTYTKPENLGEAINSKYNDFDAFIATDESYLIFSSSNRPEGFGSGDLYVSFRKKDESWTQAKNMGVTINTSSMEYCPKVSPNGKYLFFTSSRSGNGDIYWVDARIIDQLKQEGFK